MARRHGKPISAGKGKQGRGCVGLFLTVWGLGFGGGGLMALLGGFEDGSGDDWARWIIGPLFTLIGGTAVVFGQGMLWGFIKPKQKTRAESRAAPDPLEAAVGSPSGDAVLRPNRGKSCALLFLIPFTIAWNGIVYVMWDEMAGDGGFGVLFVSVFGLAGLAMIVLVCYLLLSLFNPTAEIEVDVDGGPGTAFVVGGTTEITWRMRGNTRRLPSLAIALEGREEASYRRGTDRVTDKETFFREVLAEGPELLDDAQGGATLEVTIPAGGVPSFQSNSNKVLWTIVFEADIPWWPDVKDEIDIPVGPGEHSGPEEIQ